MPSASEHAKRVLGAVVPDKVSYLNRLFRQLTPDHFSDPIYKTFYKLFENYYDRTGAVLTKEGLEDQLSRVADPGKVALYLETYEDFLVTRVTEPEFIWSIEQLRELAAEKATGEALAKSMEVLKRGITNDRGETIKGHEAARDVVLESLSAIDQNLSMMESPEGDMRKEKLEILSDYAARKKARASGKVEGIRFGISELDAKLGGLQNGELVLSAAYSSDGKTSLCVQLAHNAAIRQGKNVVFLTTETVSTVIRRKLVARHSKEEQFGLPEGLNTKDLKAGTLSEVEELKLREIVDDLELNENYGKLYIVQVPREASIATVEQRLYRLQRSFHIDLVICDYLALLRADGALKTSGMREKLSAIIKEAKRMAVTFNGGAGVPFVSPWQVNRASRDIALEQDHYTSSALAETAEATNSADVIISLLGPADNSDRYADVKGQILKNRDGETSNSLLFQVDYATSHFRSKVGSGAGFTTGFRANSSDEGISQYLDE